MHNAASCPSPAPSRRSSRRRRGSSRLIELSRAGSSSRIARTDFVQAVVPSSYGRRAGQQLVEDHAQGVDVAARVDLRRVGQHLLGAHVGQRADELSDVGLARRVARRCRSARATPKSSTFGWPDSSTRMLPGFRSRWMMPRWCACCTASQTLPSAPAAAACPTRARWRSRSAARR